MHKKLDAIIRSILLFSPLVVLIARDVFVVSLDKTRKATRNAVNIFAIPCSANGRLYDGYCIRHCQR
ncbi:Hypothetical predicted protein [Olea europaea subsp. europaea]|uniref:Uncharacterized protein n=1 Tax=Olea europaea subsp. europaea TaxID=158383 RepID=A0A8S0TQC7_OLEEU|nr:Hypothetical predicted protein [Olea europaea subsp. europaea]